MLFALQSLCQLAYKLLGKLTSASVDGSDTEQYIFFFIVNCIIASLFFWTTGGFRLEVNFPTFLYSVGFACIVFINLMSALMVYRYATVAAVNIVTCGVGTALSPLLGWLFFRDQIDAVTFIRVGVILVAAAFLYLDMRKQEPGQTHKQKKGNLLPLLFYLATTVLGLQATSIINKFYMQSPSVTDESSFCLLTNIILLSGTLVVLLIRTILKPKQVKEAFRALTAKKILIWSGTVVTSNVVTITGIWLLAMMALSVYTPVYSALGILISAAASLLLKEKLSVYSYLAAAAACVAVIL